MKATFLSFIGVIAFFMLMGLAGECDRVDAIIYNMPHDAYRKIRRELTVHGREPSDKQIASYYIEHYNP